MAMLRTKKNKKDKKQKNYGSKDDDANNDESGSMSTKELLHRARDRIQIKQLQDEIARLKDTIEIKNSEVDRLVAQLRREVSNKCDLVIAHTELEKYHAGEIQNKEHFMYGLARTNRVLVETVAETECSLINEMVQLKVELNEANGKHQVEINDFERKHKNQMLEKDFQIAQLEEELRRVNEAKY